MFHSIHKRTPLIDCIRFCAVQTNYGIVSSDVTTGVQVKLGKLYACICAVQKIFVLDAFCVPCRSLACLSLIYLAIYLDKQIFMYIYTYIYTHTQTQKPPWYTVQDTMVRELHRLHAHSCIAKLTVVDGEPIKRQRKRCHICIYSTHQHRTSFCTSNCTIQTW